MDSFLKPDSCVMYISYRCSHYTICVYVIVQPLGYAQKDRKIHSVSRNSSCGRYSRCLLKTYSLRSSLLTDRDLVQADMRPEVRLPVIGWGVVQFWPMRHEGLVFRGLLGQVFLPEKKKWEVNSPLYTSPFPLVWDTISWGHDVWSCGIHLATMRQRSREAQRHGFSTAALWRN